MKKGARVIHKKYGKGTVHEFYEFYNEIFVDVELDDYDQVGYFSLNDLTLIKETINHD